MSAELVPPMNQAVVAFAAARQSAFSAALVSKQWTDLHQRLQIERALGTFWIQHRFSKDQGCLLAVEKIKELAAICGRICDQIPSRPLNEVGSSCKPNLISIVVMEATLRAALDSFGVDPEKGLTWGKITTYMIDNDRTTAALKHVLSAPGKIPSSVAWIHHLDFIHGELKDFFVQDKFIAWLPKVGLALSNNL